MDKKWLKVGLVILTIWLAFNYWVYYVVAFRLGTYFIPADDLGASERNAAVTVMSMRPKAEKDLLWIKTARENGTISVFDAGGDPKKFILENVDVKIKSTEELDQDIGRCNKNGDELYISSYVNIEDLNDKKMEELPVFRFQKNKNNGYTAFVTNDIQHEIAGVASKADKRSPVWKTKVIFENLLVIKEP